MDESFPPDNERDFTDASRQAEAVVALQQYFASLNHPSGYDPVGELIAERRAEARRELE